MQCIRHDHCWSWSIQSLTINQPIDGSIGGSTDRSYVYGTRSILLVGLAVRRRWMDDDGISSNLLFTDDCFTLHHDRHYVLIDYLAITIVDWRHLLSARRCSRSIAMDRGARARDENKNYYIFGHHLTIEIRIGLVARICRSHSSKDDQFRQGRGSIPRFGIIVLLLHHPTT
jgi:hypothetical protein